MWQFSNKKSSDFLPKSRGNIRVLNRAPGPVGKLPQPGVRVVFVYDLRQPPHKINESVQEPLGGGVLCEHIDDRVEAVVDHHGEADEESALASAPQVIHEARRPQEDLLLSNAPVFGVLQMVLPNDTCSNIGLVSRLLHVPKKALLR